jgi:hypothetical protein
VNAGSDVTFSCAARGAPKPSIFWTREGSQELMFPGNTYQSHYTVTEDGSLSIKGAVRKDEGHYVCSAISQAGASTATVFLQVYKPCNLYLIRPPSTLTRDPKIFPILMSRGLISNAECRIINLARYYVARLPSRV